MYGGTDSVLLMAFVLLTTLVLLPLLEALAAPRDVPLLSLIWLTVSHMTTIIAEPMSFAAARR